MFHGLCIPYIGKTELSVKKPAARSLRSSLEQLTKSQLEIRLFTTLLYGWRRILFYTSRNYWWSFKRSWWKRKNSIRQVGEFSAIFQLFYFCIWRTNSRGFWKIMESCFSRDSAFWWSNYWTYVFQFSYYSGIQMVWKS